MPPRRANSIARPLKYALLALTSSLFIIAASFRLQSYLFARNVHSVLTQMQKMQLNETTDEEVNALLPALTPGILWNFSFNGDLNERCPGDACYVLHIQNWPNGVMAKLREKLNYRQDWLFLNQHLR